MLHIMYIGIGATVGSRKNWIGFLYIYIEVDFKIRIKVDL